MKRLEGGWPSGVVAESTLPGQAYIDPVGFQRELERIWFDTWLCVGRVEQVPHAGDFLTRPVGDESVIVLRNRAGGISAFYNVCRHRGTRLCPEDGGTLKGAVIRCPYHGWTYETTHGGLIAAPNVPEGADFDKAGFPLFALRVETWEGFIWINFNPRSVSLSESLGLPATYAFYEKYRVGELKAGAVMEYDVRANWKLLMDNGLECLHCSYVHPELSRCTPPALPRRWLHEELPESAVFKHSGSMELAAGFHTVSLDGTPRRPRFADLIPADARSIYYAWVYPHMMYGFAPDYVFVLTLLPVAVAHTKVWGYWLFDPEAMARPEFDGSDAVEFWDLTNRQDWRACELAQLGNRSRAYRDGGVLVQNEWRVQKFKRYVLDAVQRVTLGGGADGTASAVTPRAGR